MSVIFRALTTILINVIIRLTLRTHLLATYQVGDMVEKSISSAAILGAFNIEKYKRKSIRSFVLLQRTHVT